MEQLEEVEKWQELLDELLGRMGRRRLGKYVRGLLGRVERKNGWQLAEEADVEAPYAMQQFPFR